MVEFLFQAVVVLQNDVHFFGHILGGLPQMNLVDFSSRLEVIDQARFYRFDGSEILGMMIAKKTDVL
jgi:hypothetical protein